MLQHKLSKQRKINLLTSFEIQNMVSIVKYYNSLLRRNNFQIIRQKFFEKQLSMHEMVFAQTITF